MRFQQPVAFQDSYVIIFMEDVHSLHNDGPLQSKNTPSSRIKSFHFGVKMLSSCEKTKQNGLNTTVHRSPNIKTIILSIQWLTEEAANRLDFRHEIVLFFFHNTFPTKCNTCLWSCIHPSPSLHLFSDASKTLCFFLYPPPLLMSLWGVFGGTCVFNSGPCIWPCINV